MELILDDDIYIISETDEKGIITSVNDDFCMISGYGKDELIGTDHNIVRHPDMPKVAFEGLWRTIKTGKRWEGIVKNLAKSGDYYWVHATVTKVSKYGSKSAYTSIRQKPSRHEVESAEKLYKELKVEEDGTK